MKLIVDIIPRISGTGLGLKKTVDVKGVVPSMTWKGDPVISVCVGESTWKVNLHKQTHNMSASNDIQNNDIIKVQWCIQTTVIFVLRFV